MVRVVNVSSFLGSFDLGDDAADGIVYDPIPIPKPKKGKRKDTVSGKIPAQPIFFQAPPAERLEIGESTEDSDFQW